MDDQNLSDYTKELRWRDDFRLFFSSAANHWRALTGGSIVATIVGLYSAIGLNLPAWAAFLLALPMAIIFACFLAFRDQRRSALVADQKLKDLEDRIRPKLECTFDLWDQRCRVSTTLHNVNFIYFRMLCEGQGIESIKKCQGQIIRIQKDGVGVMENQILRLKFYGNVTETEVRAGVPAILDILSVDEGNVVCVESVDRPKSIDFDTLVKEHGEYIFTIVVTSQDNVPITKHIRFVWNGHWQSALMAMVGVAPPKPRLITDCGPGVCGCRPSAQWGTGTVLFLRIAVRCCGESPITNCKGAITSIKRDGNILWGGDSAILTFAPGQDSDSHSKTIHPLKEEYLDVLALHYTNEIKVGTFDREWRFQPPLAEIFGASGDYLISVSITSDNAPTELITLLFKWTGITETSCLTQIDPH